ncbi:hypothetical protein EVAR_19945_1 [Eumeta japonica]|uniref:Uncharacterized protein n=1 Tax=Eumeta variegata TaxID=151549 RepID=A0A4C1YGL1_EUMVA|nr:hypothetical protein EVAR_19945_1 [Eumeta japonica]
MTPPSDILFLPQEVGKHGLLLCDHECSWAAMTTYSVVVRKRTNWFTGAGAMNEGAVRSEIAELGQAETRDRALARFDETKGFMLFLAL